MSIIAAGKCSWFGGPHDMGVAANEDLALYPTHLSIHQHAPEGLFLKAQPPHTTGTARLLNPDALYMAYRWNYHITPVPFLMKALVTITNPKNGKSVQVHPADWGPNVRTGRIVDLSPGVFKTLDLDTDAHVEVNIPLPEEKHV